MNTVSITYLAGLSRLLYRANYPLYKGLYFFYKKFADKENLSFLTRNIKKGMVVLDIGANIGFYSVYMAQLVGKEGKVHSFEPCKETFEKLLRSIHGLPQVVANQAGVMDFTGEAELNLSAVGNVDNWLEKKSGYDTVANSISTITLDEYCRRECLEVDFIKMDIQGGELMALKGFSNTLDSMDRVTILMELWPYGLKRSGSDPKDVFEFLEDKKLKMEAVNGKRLHLFNIHDFSPDNYINVLIKRQDD